MKRPGLAMLQGLALLCGLLTTSQVISAAPGQQALAEVPDSATLVTLSSPRSAAPGNTVEPAQSSTAATSGLPVSPNVATNASILMYHHVALPPKFLAPVDAQYFVEPATFDSQLYYLLANGYHVVSLGGVVDALKGGEPLPPQTVVITIDDGWQDFWQSGLPIVKKYAVPVTLFAIADADSHGYMSPDERWALAHSGLDVEAHTMTHPHLTKLLPGLANSEIVNSKKALEKELGQTVRFFAYPYGDFNRLVTSMVQAGGYDAAFAAGPGPDEDAQHLFQLPRVVVSYYDTPDMFAKKVADYRWARSHSTALPKPPPAPVVTPNSDAPATPTPPATVSDPGSPSLPPEPV